MYETVNNQRTLIISRASVPTRNSTHNKFELDYASSQQIRNKAKSFKQSLQSHRFTVHDEKNVKAAQSVISRYQQIPFFNELMKKYHYSSIKFYEALTQFAYLVKISSFYKDNSQAKEPVDTLIKEQQTISRLFELTKNDKADVNYIINCGNYISSLVNLKVIKAYYKKLSKLTWGLFKRMVMALEISITEDMKITMDGFMKIKHYLIDYSASEKEYIAFSKHFIDPFETNKITADDIMRLLKSILIRDGMDNTKREVLFGALFSNFILCGIIDIKGKYQADVFEKAYSTRKMNIMSFIKILFS